MNDIMVEIRNVSKSFGKTSVVNDLNLSVQPGEFLTLLGPSGCGKTTLLRMIAGFEYPDKGDILIQGKSILSIPPNRREVNTVFQSYALFPHLTVRENIAFGLKMKKVPREAMDRRVDAAIELTQLESLALRKPAKLSGGQQQRVAIARSLVNEPKVLLLDEPLGALDLQLRRQMQISLRRLQRRLGMTCVYVTHDQEEAMTLSDRIAIMNAGRIEQLGTPAEIYGTPATPFAARFLGDTNFLSGTLQRAANGNMNRFITATSEIPLPTNLELSKEKYQSLSIRPEYISLHHEKPTDFALQGKIIEENFLGLFSRITVSLASGEHLFVLIPSSAKSPYTVGDNIFATWDPAQAHLIGMDNI